MTSKRQTEAEMFFPNISTEMVITSGKNDVHFPYYTFSSSLNTVSPHLCPS